MLYTTTNCNILSARFQLLITVKQISRAIYKKTDKILSSKMSQFNVSHTSSSVYRHRWTVFLKFIDPWNIQYLFILTNVQTGRVFDVI